MKILVLNYEFPPVGGGGGKVAENICRALVQKNHRIQVRTSLVKDLPRYEERDGYQIFRNFVFRKRPDRCSVPEMAAYVMSSLFPALRHAASWKPDVIHVHFAVPTGVIGWGVHQITGVPYVLTVHLGDIPGGCPDQTDRLFRWLKPCTHPIWFHAAAVTAVSEYVRQLALRSYHVAVQTIPNGFVPADCPQSPVTPHQPVRLVFAARLSSQKNPLFLIDILAGISKLDWQMEILGDGPLMDAVRNRVAEKNLCDRIRLYGWVKPKKVSHIMSNADILLIPSQTEGMPMVGLKALGHGLAIVGSAIGGLQDIVNHAENGFLCPVNSLEEFCTSLKRLLTSDELLASMKQRSREMATRFDLQHIVTEYESVLKQAAGKRSLLNQEVVNRL